MIKQKTIEYIISKEEMEVIKNCLLYCRHRIIRHSKYYPPHLERIEKLLKDEQTGNNNNSGI